MKLNQSTFAAAALAGLFTAGTVTAVTAAAPQPSDVSSSVADEKAKCSGKDGCKGKDKDKDKCSGKDGCKGKDKKEETIL